MSRDKDKQLAESCRGMAQASSGALEWFQDNEKLVGNRLPGLQRAFKKYAVEARKLANAAERPMSIGVFGASQAGKSFLIGRLISPEDHNAKVIFGEGDQATKLDFLTQVNPQGGKETTGLVTRFSIAGKKSPPGFDVALRLLREVDIIKILANSFVLDLGAEPDEGHEINSDIINDLQDKLYSRLQSDYADAMRAEDVYELREYLEQVLRRHALASDNAAGFWAMAEEFAPKLAPSDRAELFAPLWGGVAEFSQLYQQLKQALDQLKHNEWGYVSLDAITDRAKGILHVDTLMGLDRGGSDGMVQVAVDDGSSAALPKPVVTALTAELRVTLDRAPWDFFEHTDLLDFPGARSRADNKKVLRDNSDPDKPPRAYCFLRGKVAVLFDNYVADLDLNSMVLCVGPENQEVAKLPDLVEGWIAKTHGASPEQRQGKRTSLFFCLTKSDFLFRLSAGATQDLMINNRMDNNLRFFPGWTAEWQPGKAFDNCFLIRNPKAGKQEEIFQYADDSAEDIPDEVAVRGDKQAWLQEYQSVFEANDLVRRHVAEPAQRWQAMLSLNDGGVTYLADRFAPVCDPDLKYDQIQPRAHELRERLAKELSHFFESGDIAQRVEERAKQATAVLKALTKNAGLIGVLLGELQASEVSLGQRFLEESHRLPAEGESMSSTAAAQGMVLDLDLDDEEDPQSSESAPQTACFGDTAVRCWLDDLERKGNHEAFCATFHLSTEQFLTIVNELAVAARRYQLAARIEDFVRKTKAFNQRPDEIVHRIAMGSALLINNLVNYLGSDGEVDEAPPYQFDKPPELKVGDFPELPPNPGDMRAMRSQYLNTWLKAFRELAKLNASWGQGGLVDVEQNKRLGQLIDMLKV